MKKKILSIILSVAMIVSIIPLSAMTAFAAGDHSHSYVYKDDGDGTHTYRCNVCDVYNEPELTEVLPYTNPEEFGDYSYTGTEFKITARWADGSGIFGGDTANPVKIEPLDPSLIITEVDAVVSFCGDDYGGVGVSSGEKHENGGVDNGSTVHVTNINAHKFSFAGGSNWVAFSNITVHYIKPNPHTLTSGIYKDNGDGTHSQKCTECDGYGIPSQKEVFPYTNTESVDNYSFTGRNFKITAMWAMDSGIFGGNAANPVKIEPLDPSLIITEVDAVVSTLGNDYGDVGISSGEKREKGRVDNGSTVHVTDVNANTFSFEGGSNWVGFSDITVYYSESATAMHAFDYTDNGDGTHSQICSLCNSYGTPAQTEVLPYTNTIYVNNYSYTGTNFKVTSNSSADWDGIYGGTDSDTLTVEALDPSIIITEVDAVVGLGGSCYNEVGISKGDKVEKIGVSDGSTVHVKGINDKTFSFTGGSFSVQFKDITVHYMTKSVPHTFVDGVCACGAKDAKSVEATDGKAYAQKDSDTAIMRLMWKLEADEDAQITNVGAYVIPLDLFEVGETPTTVTYTNPTTADGEPIKSGNTFAVDVTNIPKTNYDRIFYAVPFINGNFFIEQLIEATVNEADINK